MRLTQISLANPAAVAIVAAVIAMLGVLSMFNIPAQLLPQIEKPVITVLTFWPGASPKEIESELVVPVGDAVSRMVEVRLSAADGDWLVGTPVKVSLPSDTPVMAVAVPRDALVQRGGKTYLYTVTSEGTAEQLTANIQSIVGLWVGIAEGIKPGDQVIIRGAERLSPGQPVEVIPAADAR